MNSSTTTLESLHHFLLLPTHIPLILLLEFLNSFRSFGLRFVLYNYITNEFSISDTSAGFILGVKSFVDIGFGLTGSILVDRMGVRKVSLIALSVALVGRTLLAFTRSSLLLYVALFAFSPCGDALLSVGLYRVALKKLTTPRTRPLAFGLSYAVSNMAGVCVALVVDVMRRRLKDVHVGASGAGDDENSNGGIGYVLRVVGGVYTPVRQFIVFTWIVLFVTFVIAYKYLEDWTVIDPEDLDEEYRSTDQGRNGTSSSHDGRILKKRLSDICDKEHSSQNNINGQRGDTSCADDRHYLRMIPLESAMPVEPMVHRSILQQWFPNSYQPIQYHHQQQHHQHQHSIQDQGNNSKSAVADSSVGSDGMTSTQVIMRSGLPHYKMYKTKYAKTVNETGGEGTTNNNIAQHVSPLSGILQVIKQFIFILRMRNTWKVLIFSFASIPVVLQWTASEIALPPFLERRFGESIPIYTIQSIHMFGCLIFPPFAQAFTSALEDFRVVMPGLWAMAISPVFVAMLPNVMGACIWQLVMTVGQVLWSPRQDSWTAGLAPTGMEGLFFAVGSSRALLAPLGDLAMGMMNERFNTNCPECRDSYGHFCGHLVKNGEGDNALQCVSVQESCNIFLDNHQQACPTSCTECPAWEATDPSTFWYILVVTSVTSPILAWFFLPFLRGRHIREDRCYGICTIGISRFLGVCGVPDDYGNCQLYGQIQDDSDDGDDDIDLEAKSQNISFAQSDTFQYRADVVDDVQF